MGSQLPPPTRMNLQAFKVKDVGAKQGHKLLKSKADALKVKMLTVPTRQQTLAKCQNVFTCLLVPHHSSPLSAGSV